MIKVLQTALGAAGIAFALISLFSSLTSGDITKPIHFTGSMNDPLIGRPISKNCHEAYPVLCPTYHGD